MGVSPVKVVLGILAAEWIFRNISPEAQANVIRVLDELNAGLEARKASIHPIVPTSRPPATVPVPRQSPSLPPNTSVDLKPMLQSFGGPTVVDPEAKWLEILPHPAVVLIIGKRGSGKSALAYRLLELLRFRAMPYVVGAPASARQMLPEWIGLTSSFDDVPPGAIALVDEAYLRYHARDSQSGDNKALSRLVNLSRQRDQSLLFVTQESRQVDRNIASSASVVVFKEPGSFQVEFERPELRRVAVKAHAGFQTVKSERQGWAYAFAPESDFTGMLPNKLPTFWTPQLSRIFAAGQGSAAPSSPTSSKLRDRVARARELREKGWSYRQIARALGVSKATAINYARRDPTI